jgi:hypothetical protein
MRRPSGISGLICGICLYAAGCTHEMTTPDSVETVKPEERTTAVADQG